MPKVSIIMGVYNGANRIEKAVKSLLNQTFSNFELIICDDGSSDNTYNVLCSLKNIDERIIILKNTTNKQLAYTLNKCIEVASGEYIARMDDDDYSHPERLQKQVDFLDKNPEYALVGTSINYYDHNGIWGTRIFSGEVSKLDVLKGETFAHPSVMIRKYALNAVGGYNTSNAVMRTEDFDLWVRLYHAGYKGYNIKDVLLNYFEDSNSFVKRKYKYRINEFKIRWQALKLLKNQYMYFPYVIKPLIVGLIPGQIIKGYHKIKY